MEKMTEKDGSSLDIVNENLEALKAIFPEVFTEDLSASGDGQAGGVDFEALRQLLGDAVDEGDEKYGLTWHGKKKARQIALMPSLGTLRPCPEESVDWDTTQNLFIEGDNLEVLKLLQKSYANKVKMIYIDPPYNTGKEFIYPDKFQDNLDTYLRYTGQKDDEGFKLSSNTESSGRFHTNWLNMMYPRLKLARNLLRDDGVIFISIDDGEVANLRKICDEIFGEENFVCSLIWNKQHSQQQGLFKKYHEYVLLYARNLDSHTNISGGEGIIDAGALKKISRGNPESEFTFPPGVRFDATEGTYITGEFGSSEKVTVRRGWLCAEDGKTTEEVTLSAGWTQKDQMTRYFAGEEVYDTKGQKIIEFYFNSSGKLKCLKERSKITPPTILPQYGMVSEQTAYVSHLFGAPVFERPKPVQMLSDFMTWFVNDGDIVLDFFAGSCATAESVLRSSIVSQFIMVQLPEPIDFSTEVGRAAQALDLETIAEIGKERIRRVIKNLRLQIDDLGLKEAKKQPALFKGDNQQSKIKNQKSLDLGFKVFKLDSSNIRVWNPDRNDLEQTLFDHIEHLVEGRSEEDVLYELLLKRGVELTVPIEKREVGRKEIEVRSEKLEGSKTARKLTPSSFILTPKIVYSIGYGALFACLTTEIKQEEVEDLAMGIIDWHKELEPAGDTQVVFRDSAFEGDIAKTNMAAILEQHGIKHVRSL